MLKKILPKSALTLFIFFLLIAFPGKIYGFIKTLEPIQDTYYTLLHPDEYYGDAILLKAESDRRQGITKPLLKFDLSSLPEDAEINTASLKLYQKTPTEDGATIDLGLTHGDWDEETTWNTSPTLMNIGVKPSFSLDGNQSYKQADATALVEILLTTSDYYTGFYLFPYSTNFYVEFYSRETSRPPLLEIDYDSESESGDSTAPKISNIKAKRVSIKSVKVSWETNEAATSVVEYGDTFKLTQTAKSRKMVTNHSMTITGLLPHKIYHFRVRSTDANGNEAVSKTGKFLAWMTLGDPNDSEDDSEPGQAESDDMAVGGDDAVSDASDQDENDGDSGDADEGGDDQAVGGPDQNEIDNDQDFQQMSDLVESDFAVVGGGAENNSGGNGGEQDTAIADAANSQRGNEGSFAVVDEGDSGKKQPNVISKFMDEDNRKTRIGILSSTVLTIAAAVGLLLVL